MQNLWALIMKSKRDTRISYLAMLSGLACYLLVAVRSSGFIQADEHYQIIEFANYKLGLLSANKLAWEFKAQVRPGLQPLLCLLAFKFFGLWGITDGYKLAFLLRAVTACLSVFVITYFTHAFKYEINRKLWPYYILFSYFLWFLPYINVRFSSECWSGLMLMLALANLRKGTNESSLSKYVTIGVLMGLSILFRYQSGLFVLGLIFWITFVDNGKFKGAAITGATTFLILCLGVAIDCWLYGRFTITMYNYFVANIIEGKASSFGTSPFYYYIIYIFREAEPFGVMILVSFATLCYFEPKNPVLWAIVPFVIVHSIIPHKEPRFIFPLANLSPLICILALQRFCNSASYKLRNMGWKRFSYVVIGLFILIDTAGVFAVSTTGAGANLISVSEFIHSHYDSARTNVILVGDLYIYYDMPFAKNSFYSSDGIRLDKVVSIWQDNLLSHKKEGFKNILVIYKEDITGPLAISRMKTIGLVRVYENVPELTSRIYELYNPGLNSSRIFVYEFRN